MRLPSHPTIVAYLALFVALGGTALAVDGARPSHRRAQVQEADSSAKKLRRGPRGRRGRRGPIGRTGPSGPVGPTAAAQLPVAYPSVPMHGDCFEACEGVTVESGEARCPPGQRATGGGVSPPADQRADAVVVESRPVGGPVPTGWFASVRFTVTQSPKAVNQPEVWVICTGP